MSTQNQNPQMPNPDPQQPNLIQQPPNAPPQPNTPPQQPPVPAQPPAYPIYPTYPWVLLNQLANQAILSERERAQAEIEIARLRDRNAHKELKEDAYSSTCSSSGYTTTRDRLGRMVELLNVEIRWAGHFIFSPPHRCQNFYALQLSGNGLQLILNDRQYSNDVQLVQAFLEVPEVQIRLCRTTKQTAMLLRQAISARLEVVTPPFWGGWQQDHAHRFCFLVFANGHTSISTDRKISLPIPIEPMLAATMTVAVQRFSTMVELHSDSPEQWLLCLALHAAALTTLLRQLGYPFPLALCVLAESATIRVGLQALFGFHDDPSLSLAFPPAIFTDELLRHKDVPLLVLDDCGSDFARKNSELLKQVLASHQVPWANKRDTRFFPLQALPIILSSTASAFTIDPNVLVFDLPIEVASIIPLVDSNTKHDYLAAFIQYTAEHIDDIRRSLGDGWKQAFNLGGNSLTENCVSALGILLALDNFVRDFHRHCGLTVLPLEEECPDALDWLLDLLQQTSDKLLDCGNLAAQFLSVARSMLADGTLCPSPAEHNGEPNGSVVYYDDDHLGFTISAMNAICRSLGQSRPLVLHALSEASLLCGKPVNGGTFLTRISTWNAYGQRKTERVYLLARNLFDELGDPLVFGGEEP